MQWLTPSEALVLLGGREEIPFHQAMRQDKRVDESLRIAVTAVVVDWGARRPDRGDLTRSRERLYRSLRCCWGYAIS